MATLTQAKKSKGLSTTQGFGIIIIVMLEKIINTFTMGYYLVYGAKLPSVLIINPFDVLNWMMVPIMVTPEKAAAMQLCLDTMIGGMTQILNLLWQYFIACLIIFMYAHLKGKKDQEKNKGKIRKIIKEKS